MEYLLIAIALLISITYFVHGIRETGVVQKYIKRFSRNYRYGKLISQVSGNHKEAQRLIRHEMKRDEELSYSDAAKLLTKKLSQNQN